MPHTAKTLANSTFPAAAEFALRATRKAESAASPVIIDLYVKPNMFSPFRHKADPVPRRCEGRARGTNPNQPYPGVGIYAWESKPYKWNSTEARVEKVTTRVVPARAAMIFILTSSFDTLASKQFAAFSTFIRRTSIQDTSPFGMVNA